LVGELQGVGAVDCELALAVMWIYSLQASKEPADRNDLKLSIGWSSA
jgi:hypothetical protein